MAVRRESAPRPACWGRVLCSGARRDLVGAGGNGQFGPGSAPGLKRAGTRGGTLGEREGREESEEGCNRLFGGIRGCIVCMEFGGRRMYRMYGVLVLGRIFEKESKKRLRKELSKKNVQDSYQFDPTRPPPGPFRVPESSKQRLLPVRPDPFRVRSVCQNHDDPLRVKQRLLPVRPVPVRPDPLRVIKTPVRPDPLRIRSGLPVRPDPLSSVCQIIMTKTKAALLPVRPDPFRVRSVCQNHDQNEGRQIQPHEGRRPLPSRG